MFLEQVCLDGKTESGNQDALVKQSQDGRASEAFRVDLLEREAGKKEKYDRNQVVPENQLARFNHLQRCLHVHDLHRQDQGAGKQEQVAGERGPVRRVGRLRDTPHRQQGDQGGTDNGHHQAQHFPAVEAMDTGHQMFEGDNPEHVSVDQERGVG